MNDGAGSLRPKITQGLRFRLTLAFTIFFALLLASLGFVFRGVLDKIQESQLVEALDEEWVAMRAYLKLAGTEDGKYGIEWNYRRDQPEEELLVSRLRRVLLIADPNGNPIEASEAYRTLGVESPEQIRNALRLGRSTVTTRKAPDGTEYILRSGVLLDNKLAFYVVLGRSLSQPHAVLERFTLVYFAMAPLALLACGTVGWFVSRRALRPVRELAEQTKEISGANLNLQIESRGAGDEIDHLIENFNGMVARLNRSFSQTRQFSTDVSHELRTPLTVIRGHLEVALMTAKTEEDYRDAIATALADVERLSGTVRALLHLSQAESGQMSLQKDLLNLAELVREATEQFRPLGESGGVSIEYAGAAECWIKADAVQLERMLSNLLSNAVKYTESGGAIRVELRLRGRNAELEVRDTGIGIPAEALPHIFERFYRVRQQRDDPDEGLGLGLSFVAWIVKAHGGTVAVQSFPGRGTTFQVVLPGIAKKKIDAESPQEEYVSNKRAGT